MAGSQRYAQRALAWLMLGTILLPIVGWLVGVVKLWRASRWGTPDKVAGTLMWPLALLGPAVVYLAQRGDSPGSTSAASVIALTATWVVAAAIAVRLCYRAWGTAAE